jgi:hypothetical protein
MNGMRRAPISLDAIGDAWRLLTPQIGAWIVGFLAIIGVGVAIAVALFFLLVLVYAISRDLAALSIPLFLLLLFALGVHIQVGFYRMALMQSRGEMTSAMDLLAPVDLNAMLTSLLVGLICFVLGFTVVGGIIAAGVLMFAVPLSIEQRLKPMEAVRESYQMLKDEWLMATLLVVLAAIASVLGVLALGLGILFTYPIMFLAVAASFRNAMATAGGPNAWTAPVGGPAPYYPPAAPAPIYSPLPTPGASPLSVYPSAGPGAPAAYGAGDTVAPSDLTAPVPHKLYGQDLSAVGTSALPLSKPSGAAEGVSPEWPSSAPTVVPPAPLPAASDYTHPSDGPAPLTIGPDEMERLANEMRSVAQPGAELGPHEVPPISESESDTSPRIP